MPNLQLNNQEFFAQNTFLFPKSEKNRFQTIDLPKSPSNIKVKLNVELKDQTHETYEPVNKFLLTKQSLMVSHSELLNGMKLISDPFEFNHSNSYYPKINIHPAEDDENAFEKGMVFESNRDTFLLEAFLSGLNSNNDGKNTNSDHEEAEQEEVTMYYEDTGLRQSHFFPNSSIPVMTAKDIATKEITDQILKQIQEEENNYKTQNMEKMEFETQDLKLDQNTNSKSTQMACSCKKSKCLQRYCECFRTRGFCSEACSCSDCHNTEEFEDVRDQFMREQLERNPSSFSSKIINLSTTMIYAKGCNCKKTECMKNYCECYAAKVKCTALCKCSGCLNGDQTIQEENLQIFIAKNPKKRKKSEKNFQKSLVEKLSIRKNTSDYVENQNSHENQFT